MSRSRSQTGSGGFSLIELLVVISIIGLLSTMAMVAMSGSKKLARDTKRIAQIGLLQTALELYQEDYNGSFPAGTNLVLGGNSAKALCAGGWNASPCVSGTRVYMGLVPAAPTPPDCPSDPDFTYSTVGANATDYTIIFCLGSKVGRYPAGVRTATHDGIK